MTPRSSRSSVQFTVLILESRFFSFNFCHAVTYLFIYTLLQLPAYLLYLPKSHVDWNYTSEYEPSAKDHKNRKVELTRGKMLGGSSGLNYMAYVRGSPHDYNSWAATLGDQSWDWNHMLQHFIKAERLEDPLVKYSLYGPYHGTKGPMGVTRQPHKEVLDYLEAFKEVGNDVVLDVSGPNPLGYNEPTYTISSGVRQNTAYAYLSPVKSHPNLHVLKNTLASRIIFDDDNNAVGVELITENNATLTVYARREVVVCAGAFNTPQLLMLSGVGPREQLERHHIHVVADLHEVGKNLQDHHAAMVFFKMQKSEAPPPPPPKPGDFPGSLFMGYVALNESHCYPDYQTENFVVPHDSDFPLQFCSFVFGLRDDICQSVYDSAKGRDLLLSMVVLLHPHSRGEVLLRSADPRDPPIVRAGYYSDEQDVKSMARYLEHFVRIADSRYFVRAGAEPVEVALPRCAGLARGSPRYWRCYARGLFVAQYHHLGTCALGAALDTRLRVRHVRRLRVADASVMPTLTSGNINAPVIAIAEKAADMIKEDYFKGHSVSSESSTYKSKTSYFKKRSVGLN